MVKRIKEMKQEHVVFKTLCGVVELLLMLVLVVVNILLGTANESKKGK